MAYINFNKPRMQDISLDELSILQQYVESMDLNTQEGYDAAGALITGSLLRKIMNASNFNLLIQSICGDGTDDGIEQYVLDNINTSTSSKDYIYFKEIVDEIKNVSSNWDSANSYKFGNMVYDTTTGQYYFAIKDVPVNILISNSSYWLSIYDGTKINITINPSGVIYSNSVDYSIGNIVVNSINSAIYYSLSNNNVGNSLTDGEHWLILYKNEDSIGVTISSNTPANPKLGNIYGEILNTSFLTNHYLVQPKRYNGTSWDNLDFRSENILGIKSMVGRLLYKGYADNYVNEIPRKSSNGGVAFTGAELYANYDLIITTQVEFEAMLASPTWLDAKRVLLLPKRDASNYITTNVIKIPSNVIEISGYGRRGGLRYDVIVSIEIDITDLLSSSDSIVLLEPYNNISKPDKIENLSIKFSNRNFLPLESTISITYYKNLINLKNCECGSNQYEFRNYYITGFYFCDNLVGCSGQMSGFNYKNDNSGTYVRVFSDCNKLTNCFYSSPFWCYVYMDTGRIFLDLQVFYNCNYLSGCYSYIDLSLRDIADSCRLWVHIFYNCKYINNCNSNIEAKLLYGGSAYCYSYIGCKFLNNCYSFINSTGVQKLNYAISFGDCEMLSNCSGSAIKSDDNVAKSNYYGYYSNLYVSCCGKASDYNPQIIWNNNLKVDYTCCEED